MEQFRANPPKSLAGLPVVLVRDFKTMIQTDASGKESALDMPEPSNVLQYFTSEGDKVSVRPSGTEPKIKFYIEAKGVMGAPGEFEDAKAKAQAKIELIRKGLGI